MLDTKSQIEKLKHVAINAKKTITPFTPRFNFSKLQKVKDKVLKKVSGKDTLTAQEHR